MNVPIYQVDAFAEGPFTGNPAAVCPLEDWLTLSQMQAIAEENNLSETAFIVPHGVGYRIRWFTPRCEVPLCGHATLAAAHVVFEHLARDAQSVTFQSASGPLFVERVASGLRMSFPAIVPRPCPAPPKQLRRGIDVAWSAAYVTDSDPNFIILLADEAAVRAVRPAFDALEELHPHGVAVTAPGSQVDFVSRYFAPSYGIPEDPVTGSLHCALACLWAERLSRRSLVARQLSRRGGELRCEVEGDRVFLTGRAASYLEGTIAV